MPARTVKAIYDTTDAVVHEPYDYGIYDNDGLEAIDEFVAWLNARARAKRGGMARQYTEYLKGEPDVRIRAAIRRVIHNGRGNRPGHYPASVVQQGGGWAVRRPPPPSRRSRRSRTCRSPTPTPRSSPI